MTKHPQPGPAADLDSAERFAHDLRELRTAVGNPTLVNLAEVTGVSKSVISDALAGNRLPTENTVGALVEALGGNREEWLTRRLALDPKAQRPEPLTPRQPTARRRSIPIGTAAVIAVAAAAVSIIVTSAVWNAIRPTKAPAVSSSRLH